MKKSQIMKLLALVLCAVMVLSVFASCTDPIEEPTDEETTVTTEDPTDESTTAPEDTGDSEDTSADEESSVVEETSAEESSAEETSAEETSAEETTDEETTAGEELKAPEGAIVLEANKGGVVEGPVVEAVGTYTYWAKVEAGAGVDGAKPFQFSVFNFANSEAEGNWLVSITVSGIETYEIKNLAGDAITAPTDLAFNYNENLYAFAFTNAGDKAVGVTVTVTVTEAPAAPVVEEPTAPAGAIVLEPNKMGIIEEPVIEAAGTYTYWVKVPAGTGVGEGARPFQFSIMNYATSGAEGFWLMDIVVEGTTTYEISTIMDVVITDATNLKFNYDEYLYSFDLTNETDKAVGVTVTVTVKADSCDGSCGGTLMSDVNGHWMEGACLFHSAVRPHNYTGTGEAAKCLLCEYHPECGRIHDEYTAYDENGHWVGSCNLCKQFVEDPTTAKDHKYRYTADGYQCKDCGYEPECKGAHNGVDNGDGTHKTEACDICGADAKTAQAHTNPGCADDKCDICGAAGQEAAPHSIVETTEAGETVTKYIHGCENCDYVAGTKDVPNSVGNYLSATWLAGKKQFSSGTISQAAEDGTYFWRYTKGSGWEYGWMRENYPAGGTGTPGANGTIKVGNATKIVIKVRSDKVGATVAGRVSTTGYNIEQCPAGTPAGQGNISCMVSYGTITEANKWQVFVVDMTDKLSGKGGLVWAKDEGVDYYEVDTLTLNGGGDTVLDIAYIAFVEDWATVDALVDENVVISNGTVLNPDGTEHIKPTTETQEDIKGEGDAVTGKKVTVTCACGCETVVKTYTLPATTTKFITGGKLAVEPKPAANNAKIEDRSGSFHVEKTADESPIEVVWIREVYNLKAGGQSTGNNAGGDHDINIGKAKYMVLKMRSDAGQAYTVRLGTTEFTFEDQAADTNQEGIFSDISVGECAAEGAWTTFVIELDAFGEKAAADAEGNRVIDSFVIKTGTTVATGKYMDIEYIAFVETMDDVKAVCETVTYTNITAENKTPTVTCKGDCVNKDCDAVDKKCDNCGKAEVAGVACVNKDCDAADKKCDVCGTDGVAGVACVNTKCNAINTKCEVCGLDKAGIPCVNKDCDAVDKKCDVCGTDGVAGVACVATSCSDDKCSVCGTAGATGGSHADKDFDGKCDICEATLGGANAFILTPEKLLEWSASGTGDSVNEAGNYEVKAKSDGSAIGAYFAQAAADKGSASGTEMNVGKGSILVMKFRSTAAKNIRFHVSTKAVSSTDASSDKDGFGAFYVVPAADNAWTYYIMDASKVIYGYDGTTLAFKAEENGEYIIDTFMFEQTATSGNTNFEIAYIAFAEDVASVDALLANDADAKSVNIVTHTKTNENKGDAASNATTNKKTENVVDGKIVHTDADLNNVCDNCGLTAYYSDALVIDGGDLDPAKLVVKNATASVEDGALHFAHASGASMGLDITLLDSTTTTLNDQSEINIGSARYVMIKMKSDRTGTMNLQLSTTGGDKMQKFFTRGNGNEYHIYVIDLNVAEKEGSYNAGLAANTESRVLSQIKFFMGRLDGTETDIDYIAFAENLSDVKAKVVADGDGALTVYNVPVWTSESANGNTVLDLKTI